MTTYDAWDDLARSLILERRAPVPTSPTSAETDLGEIIRILASAMGYPPEGQAA